MHLARIGIACLVLTALLLAGCGKNVDDGLPATVDASGVITIDGEPVHGASVVFIPVESTGHGATGSSNSSGVFTLNAFEAKPGAVPGSYKVQVSKTVEIKGDKDKQLAGLGEDAKHASQFEGAGSSWENQLPQKYASIVTSELTAEIPPTGTSELRLDLKSKP